MTNNSAMAEKLILAPLRGVTQRTFRNALARHFPSFDEAYSPFLTTLCGNKIKATHLKDVDPGQNGGMELVPQIIGNNPENFKTILKALKDMGYCKADLNAGCPWPMIVKRGRGAGLMKNASLLGRMLEAGVSVMGDGLSLKVRLGVERDDELLERMDLINSFRLRALAIHARTARDMYEGKTRQEAFMEAALRSANPVVYNGDIFSPGDFSRLRDRFGFVSGWMIGRGAAVNPALACEIKGIKAKSSMGDFLLDYSLSVKDELSGPGAFLGRMKEFWSYFRLSMKDGEEYWKRIRQSRSHEEYFSIVAPLLPPGTDWRSLIAK